LTLCYIYDINVTSFIVHFRKGDPHESLAIPAIHIVETAMPHMAIVRRNSKIVLYSWTTGFVPVKIPQKVMTDDDALAHASYLCRRGKHEEA
jgi:hypothetical protein